MYRGYTIVKWKKYKGKRVKIFGGGTDVLKGNLGFPNDPSPLDQISPRRSTPEVDLRSPLEDGGGR